ncbi:hypothetical protein BJV78DRAFT_104523 [Lactifluus subvellereus]|nr:hypothetical protein BJV78DRAFT_104523 [Lactifluus subvellereus]
MILLEEDSSQRPKLPTDPSVGPTNRVPTEIDPAAPSSSQPPPSASPTRPDHESLEAQNPSPQKQRGRRFWHTRLGKSIAIALVIYFCLFAILGVPTFMLRWKDRHRFKWHTDDLFENVPFPRPPPRPPQMGSQMDLSPQTPEEPIFSCSTWAEPSAPSGESNTTVAGIASTRLAFPLVDGIRLRLNSSLDHLKDFVSGTLTVDMNPDKNVPNAVLTASARYSNRQLFKASSLCLTNLFNTTEVVVHVPDREEFPSDTIDIDLQLLLPQSPTPKNFKGFGTRLPMFKQFLGDLGPHVVFGLLKLTDSSSAVTVDSVTASSIIVRTSSAEISGNFSASDRIILDTINGAVYANISLRNNKKPRRHTTKLVVATGNGPIVAQVNLHVDERAYYDPPRHGHFQTKFMTFNAPMNVSIMHVAESKPALLNVNARNTQGAIDMTLDSLYKGTFDVRTRAAKTSVHKTSVPGATTPPVKDDVEEHKLHFDRVESEWTRGWIGDDRRPEEFDRHALGCVELVNALSPIKLRWAQSSPSTVVRQ